jgi:hypothetical protein
VFQPRRWNQRYCQNAECLKEVRRWQAAKRQRWRRQNPAHRQRHCEAERDRRKRRKEQAQRSPSDPAASDANAPEPVQPANEDRAWSRGKNFPEDFCDRPGCFDPLRYSCRAKARYCGDACAEAMRQVLDRERKWLRRKTYVGRFKRQQEYEQSRRKRGGDCAPGCESPVECAHS